MLHGVVRGLRPRRIVELGSGQSTLIMAAAAERNRAEGAETELRTFDPFPTVARPGLPGLASLEAVRAQDVPLDVFTSLQDGDVLFVDTTHTVKVDSDVNRIVLDVLPALAPGVLVHVHDIFTPRDYPRQWAVEEVRMWNEQYLLEAFLSGNESFEIIAALNYLAHHHPDALGRVCPIFASEPGHEPGSFWMRRRH
jgi:predicted O-methyltransferase YrrM